MQGARYGLLLGKLIGLIFLFVLINSILYIELIPIFFKATSKNLPRLRRSL